jgi:hypothetical protein
MSIFIDKTGAPAKYAHAKRMIELLSRDTPIQRIIHPWLVRPVEKIDIRRWNGILRLGLYCIYT